MISLLAMYLLFKRVCSSAGVQNIQSSRDPRKVTRIFTASKMATFLCTLECMKTRRYASNNFIHHSDQLVIPIDSSEGAQIFERAHVTDIVHHYAKQTIGPYCGHCSLAMCVNTIAHNLRKKKLPSDDLNGKRFLDTVDKVFKEEIVTDQNIIRWPKVKDILELNDPGVYNGIILSVLEEMAIGMGLKTKRYHVFTDKIFEMIPLDAQESFIKRLPSEISGKMCLSSAAKVNKLKMAHKRVRSLKTEKEVTQETANLNLQENDAGGSEAKHDLARETFISKTACNYTPNSKKKDEFRLEDDTISKQGSSKINVLTSVEELRQILDDSLSQPNTHIISSLQMSELGQRRGGHYSPLGGYDKVLDRFLLLDTNRRYAPVWVTTSCLFNAMASYDHTAKFSRGFLIVHL